MSRPAVLRGALLRAAHACLWAEENAVWHRDTAHASQFNRERTAAQLRVERVLTQAQIEGLIDANAVRQLLGLVLGALVDVRWRHDPRHQDHAPSLPDIERSLDRDLRQAWSRSVRWLWRLAA